MAAAVIVSYKGSSDKDRWVPFSKPRDFRHSIGSPCMYNSSSILTVYI